MTIFIKIFFNNIMLVETSRLEDDYGKGFDSEMHKKPIDLLNDLLTDKKKIRYSIKISNNFRKNR